MTQDKRKLGRIMKRKRMQKQPPADLSMVETERVFKVELPQEGMRVDKFILERTPWMSRTKAVHAFDEERVLKNDLPVAPGKKLRAGDIVKLILPPPHEDITEMARIPYDIVYEDDTMFVVSKPPHLIVHPTGGYRYTTLLNALHLRFQDTEHFPRLVNRIDKETSGLIICGKTGKMTGKLGKALEDKEVVKDYLALVEGVVELDHQFIDLPIGRDEQAEVSMLRRVVPAGQHASTEVWTVERFKRFSLVRCRLHTGRMHQIRVHMQAIGHPLVCDHHYGIRDELLESDLSEPPPPPTRIESPYGFKEGDSEADVTERIRALDTLKRHEYEALARGERVPRGEHDALILGRCALHSHYLKLTHPSTKQELELTAPLPPDMANAIDRIRRS
ncbi:MAG: Ribosomal large subunit pseudouridine synthase D [Planctomycetes bacterium]|nr:Ribosomal large subunit pseudouridine synthase D [Planctomycetota bacterium]